MLQHFRKCLIIDEFKGNTGGEKYNCIITDPKSGTVLDILKSRKKHELTSYFKDKNKNDVKFFISDMWEPYRDLATVFFKNATQIVDKYHYIRQVIWYFSRYKKTSSKKFTYITKLL